MVVLCGDNTTLSLCVVTSSYCHFVWRHHLHRHDVLQVVSSPNHPRPLVITVISNMYRDSHEKLILNPNTTQNFEDVLADLQNMVTIPHPPVRALYTESKPHIKVRTYVTVSIPPRYPPPCILCQNSLHGSQTL